MRRFALALLVLLAPAGARAAITYVGVGSTAPVISTGTCTPTTASVSWQAGDYLVVIAGGEGAGAASGAITLSTANSFTAISGTGAFWNDGDTIDETGETAVQAFGKIATSTSDSMPVVADSGDHTSCMLIVFRGVDQTTPVNCAASDGTDASDTSGSFPTCTLTAGGGGMVLLVEHNTDDAADTSNCATYANTNLASITEREDEASATALGGGFCVATATYSLGSGALGATTYTADNVRRKALFTLALRRATETTSNPFTETATASDSLSASLSGEPVLVGSPITCSGTGNTTFNCSIPASTYQTDDVLIALFGNGDNQCGATPTTNVTGAVLGAFTRDACDFATSGSASVWHKVATANQGASSENVSFLNDDGSGGSAAGTLYIIRGASTSGPWNLTNTGSGTGTSHSISLTGDDKSMYFGAFHAGTAATTSTANSDTTWAYNASASGQGNALGTLNKFATSATLGGTWGASVTWQGAMIEVQAAAGGGPQTYTEAFTESVTSTDSLAQVRTTSDSVTESASASDSATGGLVLADAYSETATAGDSLTQSSTMPQAYSESTTANDSLAQSSTMPQAYSESASAGDSLTAGAVRADAFTEGAAATDSMAQVSTMPQAYSESTAANDSLAQSSTMPQAYSESASAGDSMADNLVPGGGTVYTDSFTETASPSDSLAQQAVFAQVFSEGVAAADAVSAGMVYVNSFTETTGTGTGSLPLKVWDGTGWR